MILESTRLLLVEVSWDDLNDIHHLHSIAEVDEFNTLGLPKDVSETKAVIQPIIDDQNNSVRRLYMWKILEKETESFTGVAGFTLSRDKFRLGEIYYKFLPKYWGRGLATETAKTLIKAGFELFDCHKVEAGVATDNLPSIKVLEKTGMIREGLRRKILPIRGEWKDNYHYAIVEDDPRDY